MPEPFKEMFDRMSSAVTNWWNKYKEVVRYVAEILDFDIIIFSNINITEVNLVHTFSANCYILCKEIKLTTRLFVY